MIQPIFEEELGNTGGSGRWMLTIFNNDHSSFEEVIHALIQATGCDGQEAAIEAWEAHHFGKCAVHFAGKEVCEEAAVIIQMAGVQTEVAPEWND